MIKTVDHFVASSLKEYLVNCVLEDARGFKNVTGLLTPYDPKIAGKTALGSAYGSFVYDSGVGGTISPSIGISGAITDYLNGRYLVPSGSYTTQTGVFTVPEINFYVTSKSEAKLIFESKPLQSPDFSPATGYIPPNSIVAPCVFVKPYFSESEDFALGGEVLSQWTYKIIAMMKTESQLLNIQQIVRDSRDNILPLIRNPVLGQYGQLNNIGWTYESEQRAMSQYCRVEDATFKIQELDIFTDDNPGMFVGIGVIDLSLNQILNSNQTFPSLLGAKSDSTLLSVDSTTPTSDEY